MVRERFGVDEDICTGDHACIRLSGCPSLSVKHLDDPLRDDPVAVVDNSCVGCGNCGEVAEAAVLCPSFYRADIVHNPTWLDRAMAACAGPSSASCSAGATPPRRPSRPGERRDALAVTLATPLRGGPADQHRRPGDGRPGRRRAVGLDRGAGGGGRLGGQSTSVPGVAQRTGATIYYVEMLQAKDGKRPDPVADADAGRRGLVLAAEFMEAGRSMLRGLVTPDRTT